MAGLFGQDSFWRNTLPHLALREPAVHHALDALYSFHRQSTTDWSQNTISLISYNRAITHLARQNLRNYNESVSTVLVVCALFVCIEFLRDEKRNGIIHIKSGLMILEENQNNTPLCATGYLSEISDFFWRLRIQATVYDPSLFPRDAIEARKFESRGIIYNTLLDAKQSACNMFPKGLALVSYSIDFNSKTSIQQQLAGAKAHLQQSLNYWHQLFDDLSDRMRHLWNRENIREANILKIQGEALSIWIATCFETNQTIFDSFTSNFERIILLAEQTVADLPANYFCLDMGIIPVLHLVGVKCRNRSLRRRVLSTLGSKRWKEGSYDSHFAYRVVYRQMTIEEMRLKHADDLPAEQDRIQASNMTSLMRADATSNTFVLELSIPKGYSGQPKVWQESISLEGQLPTFSEFD
jgi:hypothetical protein